MKLRSVLRMPRLVIRALREVIGDASFREQLQKEHPGLKLGRGVEVRGPHLLEVGRHVQVDRGVLLHCGGMEWSKGRGRIRIGDHSYIGPNCVLFGAGEIIIGNHVLIAPSVVIVSHQHTFAHRDIPLSEQPTKFAPVTIEDNVWIGSSATILPGVRLGKGSIIGAGAVVTRDVLPDHLAMGVPARSVRKL